MKVCKHKIWLFYTVSNDENFILADEELIRWGWQEDVWFHVDKESSAHVYLRLRAGETLDDIPSSVIDDCAQLVKAKGNKLNNIDVIFTLWSNLKKTADMEVFRYTFFWLNSIQMLIK